MKIHVFIIEDQVDVNFMQECKIGETEKSKIGTTINDENYELVCVPCNSDTVKPSAGVVCASVKDEVQITVPKRLTEEFQEAWKTGRVENIRLILDGRG